MGILGRIWKKTKEVGFRNCLMGVILRLKYMRMQKTYRFATWHFSPYEWRGYLQATAKYINIYKAETVVDIGCGLGGLLRHINATAKIGMDMRKEVISAARDLSDESIKYSVGVLGEAINGIDSSGTIDYLITLGFTHGSREEKWIPLYHNVAKNYNIKHFVVDTVPEDGISHSHFLDYSRILPENYMLIERMGPFLGGRCVEVWEKR